MASVPGTFLTPEEYLELERNAETKSEYYRGEMFAMSGASWFHSLLTNTLAGVLYRQIRGTRCASCSSDTRIFIPATGLYTYPDLSIVCGEPRFADNLFDTLLNPTVVVEVLSPSTEAYDRGRKFQHYRSIESLRHYVLIAQDRMSVDLFSLQNGQWVLASASRPEDVLRLEAIGCEIPVGELYEKVEFPPEEPPQPPEPERHRI